MSQRPLSMVAQTAWLDLQRLLKDDAVGDTEGTPGRKLVNGKTYWFDRHRIGETIVEKYIGEDSPEMQARLARLSELRAERQARERERARLVRLLRAEGLLVPDMATGQILTALAQEGAFRLGATLVGTHAFRHFEGMIGVHLGTDFGIMTEDIDLASFQRLSLALADAGDRTALAPVFADFAFDPVPSLDRRHVWRWRQTKRNTLVEFLTPSFEADEGLRELPALGVSAQALHFLNYLIADAVAVPVLYRSGALIRVPRPERYAIHKLIVAERRRDGAEAFKSRKDRAQADFLIRHFAAEDPWLIADAYREATEKGPRWRELIGASLARMPETRAALDRALAA